MKNFIRYLIVLALLVTMAGISSARTPRMHRMVYYELEVVSFDKTTGKASIAVTITPDMDKPIYRPKTIPELCKEIPIQITTPDNLMFKTEQNLLLDFDGKENITIIVEITLVEQTTMQIVFHASCLPSGKEITDIFYLVPDSEDLSVTRLNPIYKQVKPVPLNQEPNRDTMTAEQLSVEYDLYVDLNNIDDFGYVNNMVDSLIPTLKKGVYIAKLSLKQIYYEVVERKIEAEFVRRPPWDKRTTQWENYETPPEKNTKHEITITEVQLSETDIYNGRKRQAEQYVLEDKPQESFYIDGVMWQRNKGEQYFRKVEGILDTDAYGRMIQDSLAALPDDHLYELCLIIPQDKISKAIEILVTLPEPISEVFYHLNVKKVDIPKLGEVGIRYSYRHNTKCNHILPSDSMDSKKN